MFLEEKIKTKVENTYDVAVCGGGIAGISAALAAARRGAKTVLLERTYMLGGLATAGIVTIYLPLCDGFGHQVSFGIAEELLRLSIKHGAETAYPEKWLDNKGPCTENDERFKVQYNPQLFAILAEELLIKEGVEILYGTYAVGVDVKNKKIEHIITENKSGRQAFKVKSVVDATGDCDIAYFANIPCENFKQGNILAGWYYSVGESGYKLNMLGASDIPDDEQNEKNKVEKLINRRFSGLDGKELSQQMCLSHQATYKDFLNKRENDKTLIPVTVATIPQVRMTRKIMGEYVLKNQEEHKFFEDSIGMVSNWKKRGPIWEVPFRTLYNSAVKNLICAGRCVSTDQTLWDVMRVIPCCAVTGEAAGTAAAMSDDMTTLSVTKLQKILTENGVVLHENEIM